MNEIVSDLRGIWKEYPGIVPLISADAQAEQGWGFCQDCPLFPFSPALVRGLRVRVGFAYGKPNAVQMTGRFSSIEGQTSQEIQFGTLTEVSPGPDDLLLAQRVMSLTDDDLIQLVLRATEKSRECEGKIELGFIQKILGRFSLQSSSDYKCGAFKRFWLPA